MRAIFVGRSVDSAITQTPASGPLGLVTVPPTSSASMATPDGLCCASSCVSDIDIASTSAKTDAIPTLESIDSFMMASRLSCYMYGSSHYGTPGPTRRRGAVGLPMRAAWSQFTVPTTATRVNPLRSGHGRPDRAELRISTVIDRQPARGGEDLTGDASRATGSWGTAGAALTDQQKAPTSAPAGARFAAPATAQTGMCRGHSKGFDV